jgi:hypothetical protein
MERKKSNRVWKWFAVLGILLIAIAVVAKVRSLRHETNVTGCRARLHEVAFAVSKYNQKHGHLPPRIVYKDGVAMHSWRVLILEDWQPQLFAQYRLSEPWNSPHNSQLAKTKSENKGVRSLLLRRILYLARLSRWHARNAFVRQVKSSTF